jgi:predicted ATPase/DNA-binding CsgD family transcriptional regulator
VIGRVSSPLFVGRREELAVLEGAVSSAAEGTGAVVMIGGEAGMGKSRLVAQLGGLASAAAATLVIGECLPLGDGELPYAPIVTALRSLLRAREALEPALLEGTAIDELARLLPELGGDPGPSRSMTPDQAGSSGRLFEQLLAVFVRLARDAPIVLAVEDLHWSDPSTRDFLTFLVRGIRRERLALVLTYRNDEIHRRHPARPFLLELERSGQAMRLELRAFGRGEIREQVTAILDQEPAPKLLDSLLDRAEGNPFFTEELLATVADPDAPLPESLRDAMLFRIEGSSEQVQAVLRVAAVAGREVDHSLLTAVAGIEAHELLDAVRKAVQSHLLVENPDAGAYGFRHALLREAVYNDLLSEERRALHLELARALTQSVDPVDGGAAPAELAHHWYAARQLPQALEASIDAGLQAEDVRAPGEALAHYERALELWDRVDPAGPRLSRIEVMQRAGEAAAMAGDNDRAIALARDILDRLNPEDPVGPALAHERLGRYLWMAGRGEEALPEYQRAVALMPKTASRERALVLAAEAQVLMLCNFTEPSEQRCEEALQIATDVGAEDIEAHVLNTMCANFSYRGEFEQAVASAKRGLELAQRFGVYEEIGRAFVNGSDALDQAGRVRESIAFAHEGIAAAAASGDERYYGDFLRAEIASRLIRTGAWDDAEALLSELLERTAPGVNSGLLFHNLADLYAERGDYEAAIRAAEQANDHIGTANGSMWLAPMAAARAAVELWRGDPAAASKMIDDALAQFGHGEYVFFTARLYHLGVRAHADLCAVALDDAAAGGRELKRASELLARLDKVVADLVGEPQPHVRVRRALCAAELSRITGADADAWHDAERLAQAIGDTYEVAYARWRRAEALIESAGAQGLAQELASQAFRTADELGARPLRQAVETLMRAARLAPTPAEHPATGADPGLERFDLTPREIEVLALLGEGMTNREIAAALVISDKTASVHVSRILAKLSVTNRASAAVLAQRLGVARAEH